MRPTTPLPSAATCCWLDYHAEPCKFSLVSDDASVAARFITRPGTLMMIR